MVKFAKLLLQLPAGFGNANNIYRTFTILTQYTMNMIVIEAGNHHP